MHSKTCGSFFESGETLSYKFRKNALELLKNTVIKYEEEINSVLYSDLKKSKEETWVSETGLLLSEISDAIKNLHKWMKPRKLATGLVTFPSSAKIYRQPLGVVLIIAPWNYPLQLLLIPLVGAIAAGNCAVLKPSELAPATAEFIVRVMKEIFPEDYVRVITGEGSMVVPALMNQFRFDHVFYTGSTTTGKEIYKLAANNLIPVTLELGGKSPCIVYEDADITITARRIVLGKFLNAGQTCIAPDYILVQQSIKNDLLEELKNTIQKFYSDNPATSGDFGRIINLNRFKKLVSYIHPKNIFFGGKSDAASLYIEPTILTDISLDDSIMKEEIFGPILPVLPFGNTQEAMTMVKQNENPLALYLFTANKKTEEEWVRKVSFGGGCINNTVVQNAIKQMPFGGVGNSGLGAYHGKNTFDTFTHEKPVLKSYTKIDPSLRYPPFKGKLKWFKKLIG